MKGVDYMIELITTIGASTGASLASFLWFFEEPECPQSLIK